VADTSTPVALVTGAASGIGRAVARRLADDGLVVVALDVDRDGLESVGAETGGRLVPIVADVGSPEDCRRAVEEAAARGRLGAVVNVAGIMVDDDAVETIADDDLERLFRVNVFGVFRLARAAIPALRRAGGGVVVNVSSVHAYASQERAAAYGAS
jgi:NAD(P)-dependent dehydrogenase (short-subunit alcohol dehydrogenase family)